MAQLVTGVTTKDDAGGRDVSDLINAVSLAQVKAKVEPVWVVGGMLAESGLRERAIRKKDWPDWSVGFLQPTLLFFGHLVPGVELEPGSKRALQTDSNWERFITFFSDGERNLRAMVPIYAGFLQKHSDPLEAWCRYNRPSIPGSKNPNRENYRRSLEAAQEFLAQANPTGEVTMPAHRELRAHLENFEDSRFAPKGVVIHATRGNTDSLEEDYLATLNWFQNPKSQVSAHLVIGPRETALMVPLRPQPRVAFHAGHRLVSHNRTHIGIEVAQPASEPAFSDRQYIEVARWLVWFHQEFSIPAVHVGDDRQPGYLGHEETRQGKLIGKSDPGRRFDYQRLDREIQAIRSTFTIRSTSTSRQPEPVLSPALQDIGEWARSLQGVLLKDIPRVELGSFATEFNTLLFPALAAGDEQAVINYLGDLEVYLGVDRVNTLGLAIEQLKVLAEQAREQRSRLLSLPRSVLKPVG